MIEYYTTAKERIDNLAVTHARALAEAEEETQKYKERLYKTNKQLKKLFQECLKPLMAEVKLKDEIIDRWKNAREGANADLKMLNSIIRIPRLCGEFQRACKRKETAEAIQKGQKEASEHIMAEMNKSGNKDEENFID